MKIMSLSFLSALGPVIRIKKSGEDLALDFITVLASEASENRVVILHRQKMRGAYSHLGGWEWMANAEWRRRVDELIVEREVPVRNWEFHPMDTFGDWSFHAISTVATPRVSKLPLTAVL